VTERLLLLTTAPLVGPDRQRDDRCVVVIDGGEGVLNGVADLPRAKLGDPGELLDERAKSAYRRRLAGTYCAYLPDSRAPAGWEV
jgi:hypothetical protein